MKMCGAIMKPGKAAWLQASLQEKDASGPWVPDKPSPGSPSTCPCSAQQRSVLGASMVPVGSHAGAMRELF